MATRRKTAKRRAAKKLPTRVAVFIRLILPTSVEAIDGEESLEDQDLAAVIDPAQLRRLSTPGQDWTFACCAPYGGEEFTGLDLLIDEVADSLQGCVHEARLRIRNQDLAFVLVRGAVDRTQAMLELAHALSDERAPEAMLADLRRRDIPYTLSWVWEEKGSRDEQPKSQKSADNRSLARELRQAMVEFHRAKRTLEQKLRPIDRDHAAAREARTLLSPTELQVFELREALADFGMDYGRAFEAIRHAAATLGADTIRQAFEGYLEQLSRLLAKNEGRARGNFGSLDANREFAKELNGLLDDLNLRIDSPHGPASLNTNRQPSGRLEGRWQYKLSQGGTRGSVPEMPVWELTARVHNRRAP